MPRRSFDKAFKIDTAKLILEDGMSVSVILTVVSLIITHYIDR